MVELQFDKHKGSSNRLGGEFHTFSSYLNEKGILHRLSCPHIHHKNSVVQCKHRHIVELGLSLLRHASPPLSF